MKTIRKIFVLVSAAALMLIADMPPQLPPSYLQLVPEAHAVFGVRRRTARRTAVVVGTTAYAAGSAQGQKQAAAAQQQAAPPPASQQPATPAPAPQQATPPPAQPAAGGKPLPLGTVVPALPAGCTTTPVGGVQYYYCGGNFYRAVFQGNALVYVTAQPK